jgi:PAS domain-containing protein
VLYFIIRALRSSLDAGDREIRRRRQAETALRDNEEKFRKVFHTSPVAISITTLEEGRLLEANYAYWDLTGLDMGIGAGKDIRRPEIVEIRQRQTQIRRRPEDQRGALSPG